MKNFRVTDGDLDINTYRQVDMVLGRDKLVQDLTLWLLEPLGIGYSTPSFGSTLNTTVAEGPLGRQDGKFIGQPYADQVGVAVEAEVDRVLNLYQQDQIQKIKQAQSEGRLYLYMKSEILNSIDSVAGSTSQDTAIISVSITTGANQALDLLAQVDTLEASIAVT